MFLAFFVAAVLYYIERQQTHLSHWICQFQRQDLKNNTNTFSKVPSQSFCQFEHLVALWKHSLLPAVTDGQKSGFIKTHGRGRLAWNLFSHLPKIIVLGACSLSLRCRTFWKMLCWKRMEKKWPIRAVLGGNTDSNFRRGTLCKLRRVQGLWLQSIFALRDLHL